MNIDDSMYRLTVAQRATAWREIEMWQRRYDELAKMLANHAALQAHPPVMMMANKESYEAGRIKGKADANEELREDIAQLVEAMGMQGYGTLAIAAAIRKGKA